MPALSNASNVQIASPQPPELLELELDELLDEQQEQFEKTVVVGILSPFQHGVKRARIFVTLNPPGPQDTSVTTSVQPSPDPLEPPDPEPPDEPPPDDVPDDAPEPLEVPDPDDVPDVPLDPSPDEVSDPSLPPLPPLPSLEADDWPLDAPELPLDADDAIELACELLLAPLDPSPLESPLELPLDSLLPLDVLERPDESLLTALLPLDPLEGNSDDPLGALEALDARELTDDWLLLDSLDADDDELEEELDAELPLDPISLEATDDVLLDDSLLDSLLPDDEELDELDELDDSLLDEGLGNGLDDGLDEDSLLEELLGELDELELDPSRSIGSDSKPKLGGIDTARVWH